MLRRSRPTVVSSWRSPKVAGRYGRGRCRKYSAGQLCELAKHYAKQGDSAFLTRLYEIVERKPFIDSPWLGEEEIIELDGESALVFAIEVRGRGLANREWAWDDERLIEQAIERFGEDPV